MRLSLMLLFIFISNSSFAFSIFSSSLDPIKERLKDPYSARFENVKNIGHGMVCGKVNAKNSYGGYDGYKWFYINNEAGYFKSEDENGFKSQCIELTACIDGGKSADQCIDLRNEAIQAEIKKENEIKKNVEKNINLADQAKRWSESFSDVSYKCDSINSGECSNEIKDCTSTGDMELQINCFNKVRRKY